MTGKAFDVDKKMSSTKSLWATLPSGAYVLLDKLTLIDETANFAEHPFQVRDNIRYHTHYPGEVEFRLITFFDEPRTREDVERFFQGELLELLSDSTLVTETLDSYMGRIIGLGLLKPAPEGRGEGELWAPKDEPMHFVAPGIQTHDKTVRSFPTTVAINLTEKCNLSCLHCSVGSNPFVSSANDLTAEELSKVFTELEQGGAVTVRLTGGEATIRPDFWDIFEDAASRRFSLVLFTNGSRITKEDVARLKKVSEAKGSRFSVHLSLDGGTAESHDFLRNRKGNFKRVLRTMDLFHKNGIHFFVESVLHANSFTAEEVDRVATIVHQYGASWCSFHPADQVGTAEGEDSVAQLTREDKVRLQLAIQPIVEKWKPLGLEIVFSSYNYPLSEPAEKTKGVPSTKLPERTPQAACGDSPEGSLKSELSCSRSSGHHVCTAGIAQFALGADGRVYGCPRYVGDDDNAMGSVRDDSLSEIWNSDKWDWLREDYGPRLSLCQHCDYQTNCFYGKTCRANPGRVFRDRYGVGPECIQEYQTLGIPYKEVTSYLKKRIEMFPDDASLVKMCEGLLKEVRVKESERAAGETARPVAESIDE